MDYRSMLRKRKAKEDIAVEENIAPKKVVAPEENVVASTSDDWLTVQPRIILERIDDKNPEVIEIDENVMDNSVEFVSEGKATNETIQIARLNRRIAKLEHELKLKNQPSDEKKNEPRPSGQIRQSDLQGMERNCAGPSNEVNNAIRSDFTENSTDQSNHDGLAQNYNNDSLLNVSLSDSVIERISREWHTLPNHHIDGILNFLDPTNQ